MCGLAGKTGSIYVSFSLLSASFGLAFFPPIPQQQQMHGWAPTLTYQPPTLGSVALLPTARYSGFNSGGDEIGSARCSGWWTPAKVVSVSRQLILCQSSGTSRLTDFLLTVRVFTFLFKILLFVHTYS